MRNQITPQNVCMALFFVCKKSQRTFKTNRNLFKGEREFFRQKAAACKVLPRLPFFWETHVLHLQGFPTCISLHYIGVLNYF